MMAFFFEFTTELFQTKVFHFILEAEAYNMWQGYTFEAFNNAGKPCCASRF